MFNSESWQTEINQGAGYSAGKLLDGDLDILRRMVIEQFSQVIQKQAPDEYEDYRRAGIDEYHNVYDPSHFDHSRVWVKRTRVFSQKSAETTLSLPTFQAFKKILGDYLVGDEEYLAYPNFNWRLVRPGRSDIAPMHADKWFWELGHGTMPEGHYRQKIWVPLFATPGKSGLRVVPESQNSLEYPYHGELRAGLMKPVLDVPESELDILDLPLRPGEFVVFHDSLLHGGMPNTSDKTRVSLECTFLRRK